MPAQNIVKQYFPDGIYHLYNRGVEKRNIFNDDEDCTVFLHYLRLYLSPTEELKNDKTKKIRVDKYIKNNLSHEVHLIAFTLMPNHFHLILKQFSSDGIIKLMRRFVTAYAMYFNKKYKRIGHLFQNIYKAIPVDTDEYILHLSRYVHLNPMVNTSTKKFIEFSSYPYYLGNKKASWVRPEIIIEYFKSAKKEKVNKHNSYQSFVEDYKIDSHRFLSNLTLE